MSITGISTTQQASGCKQPMFGRVTYAATSFGNHNDSFKTHQQKPVQFGANWLGNARKAFGALAKNKENQKAMKGVFIGYVLPTILMSACLAIPVVGWCMAIPMGLASWVLAKWGDRIIKNSGGSFINKAKETAETFTSPHENTGNITDKIKNTVESAAEAAENGIEGDEKAKEAINKAKNFFTINPDSKLGYIIDEMTQLKRKFLNRSRVARFFAGIGKKLRTWPITRPLGLLLSGITTLTFFLFNGRKILTAYNKFKNAKNIK